jgi:hypothetical protein
MGYISICDVRRVVGAKVNEALALMNYMRILFIFLLLVGRY